MMVTNREYRPTGGRDSEIYGGYVDQEVEEHTPGETESAPNKRWTKNGESVKQAQRKSFVNPKAKRKESALAIICAWIVEHQIGLATNLLLLLALTHLCFPRARRQTRKFFDLSYYDTITGQYGIGWDDMLLVLCWIVVFTGLRAFTMDHILVPVGQWGGVLKQKERVRFAEQGWILMYYGAFWSMGMHIMYNSKYWLNFHELWTKWPIREIDGLTKWYYLVQFAFWIQQILVVNIEERRKDYHQMFTHHVVTCVLIFSSYGYHHTRVGNMILCIFDAVDLILPTAKILKYLRFKVAPDVAFVVFMVTWFVSRHILFLMVIHSIYRDTRDNIPHGCYTGRAGEVVGPYSVPDKFDHLIQPFLNPEGTICWTNFTRWSFLSLLLFLQGMTLVWFGMIMRVAYKFIKGEEAHDSRSDDEDEEETEDDEANMEKEAEADAVDETRDFFEAPPLEEEVGVEAINLKDRTSPARRFRKGGGSSSGVTLPGHSDRKELLGRIGCDKGS
ncbi:MAG: sphingosine N-acyltransferase lag1 [Pycnora praestabilis]|nr:MAG: sphingosine N-acyltransferase lag1 [Pycnora praestabilis]